MRQIMKTRRIIIALSILAAVYSCNKTEQLEQPQAEGDLVTITAILPDGDAVKGAGLKTSLSWTWNAGDKITVVGTTTETFKIKDGFTPKKAEFVGKAVKGTSFTILYPGEDANETDWNTQVQKGNNNLDHLKYQASLNDVDEYTTFAFDPEWAEAHGGTLKQTGVLKLTLTMPEGMTKPDSIAVVADDPIFFAGNAEESKSTRIVVNIEDCTVTEGDLVAWFTTSWNDVEVAAGTTLYVMVYGETKTFSRDVIISGGASMKTGYVNLFTLTGGGWADEAVNAHYAGGKGTKVAPWILQTKEQMAYINGDLVDGSIRYYKLDADIDMTGADWTPLNGGGENKQYIDFDGNNHKLSKLDTTFISVLVGNVKNLTIEDATVDGGSAIAGILANTVGSGVETSIVNVDIKNSSVKSTTYAGGLLGQSTVDFTITDCDVVNTTVGGTLVGGVVGFADCKITMTNCSFEGGTVNATARYAGGLLGSVAQKAGVISKCTIKDATINSTKDRVGGAVGQLQQTAKIENTKAENVTVKGGTQNIGGLVGVCYGTLTGCSVSGSVTSAQTNTGNYATNLGGIAGYAQHEVISGCYSTATVNAKGANIGGLIGNYQGSTESGKSYVEKSYATGDVTGTYRYIGGLVGIVTTTGEQNIKNCYCTGKVSGNGYTGGLIGGNDNGKIRVNNCFASGDVTGTGFAVGGLIGHEAKGDAKVEKCVAWAAKVTAGSIGAGNWSSGAVVGVTFPTCTLTDNYRNPAMDLTAYWGTNAACTFNLAADYQHANVSASTPLVKQDGNATTATGLASGQDGYPQFPYHGKVEAGKTLSALAKDTLGWPEDIWDFSGDTPKLK